MSKKIKVDVAIFGGGIAGLWTLLKLRKHGYSAILFEANNLGGKQSVASQGILHGGTKYALTGKQSAASEAISKMPAIWQSCLQGKGEIDLTKVRVFTQNQLLWSTKNISSKLSGFFASKLMRSRIQTLQKKQYPAPFDSPSFKGSLYSLDEPVLDTASLMSELAQQALPFSWHLPMQKFNVKNHQFSIVDDQQEVIVDAQKILLSAGEGNVDLLNAFSKDQPKMQKRLLHMVMLRGNLPMVFAHCLGVSSNPRVTITSYPSEEHNVVWYLGGQIAEAGIDRTTDEQIKAAKKLLKELLPWVKFDDMQWQSFKINRAEPLMPNGERPADCFLNGDESIFTTWPTKLVFAPRVASKFLDVLEQPIVGQAQEDFSVLSGLGKPAIAIHPASGDQQWQ